MVLLTLPVTHFLMSPSEAPFLFTLIPYTLEYFFLNVALQRLIYSELGLYHAYSLPFTPVRGFMPVQHVEDKKS